MLRGCGVGQALVLQGCAESMLGQRVLQGLWCRRVFYCHCHAPDPIDVSWTLAYPPSE